MASWYKNRWRRNLVDMHIEDWDPEFLSKFDPDEYVRMLQMGRIDAPMLYLQSHVGLCYWPTESGKMHAGFASRPDAMKQLEAKCHALGMDVIAYYSLIYNNWAYQQHPDWRMIGANGEGSRDNGNRYGLCCPNNGDYRAFTEAQIKELCAYFDFEGIFLDMTFWPMICYCDQCKARWEKEVGGEMPRTIDWHDEGWLKFQQKRTEWLAEFANWATNTVRRYKPGCAVEHQYSPIMHYWRFGVTENITEASTYAGGDLYGGIAEQSFACKLYSSITRDQPFEYMTSRCYPALSEHTTTKSEDLLKLSVMSTYMHHGACLLIDAIDPVGTLDERVYERIGRVFTGTMPYEPYLDWGALSYDVALYYDLNGKYNVDQAPAPIDSDACRDAAMPMQQAVLGAARSLREHHIPYGVITNWKLSEQIHQAGVLAICDVPRMTEDQVDIVLGYVGKGGKLYVSGHAPARLLEALFGLTPAGLTDETVTYISPTDAGAWAMEGAFTRDYPMALFERQVLTRGETSAQVLGAMTLPYTIPNAASACTEPFFAAEPEKAERVCRFASIHSNPPGRFTDRPAIVRAQYGSGEAIWCSASIERANREQHSDIFANLIGALIGDEPLFRADAPECVECVLFDAPEKEAKLLGLLNLQEAFHTQAVHNFTISVKCDAKPSAICLLPDEIPMDFTYDAGYATVRFDKLESYAMFLVRQ